MEYLNFSKEKGKKFAEAVALWTDKNIKRIYWTNEEIDKWFGKRSIKEIIKNGTTCFMNPCFDLTLVSVYLLNKNKIKNNLVVEEHLPTKEFNFNRLHFALDFIDENEIYHLNYKHNNFVYISTGEYLGRKDLPQAQIIRFPGEKINSNKPIYQNLSQNVTAGFSLEKNLQRLKQDNNRENYYQYKQQCGDEFIINSQQQSPPSI